MDGNDRTLYRALLESADNPSDSTTSREVIRGKKADGAVLIPRCVVTVPLPHLAPKRELLAKLFPVCLRQYERKAQERRWPAGAEKTLLPWPETGGPCSEAANWWLGN